MKIFTKLASFFNSTTNNSNESINPDFSLTVSQDLKDFLENEVINGLDISPKFFWDSFEKIVNEFSPRNKDLLSKREEIQLKIDAWHVDKKGQEHDAAAYKAFL